MDELMSRHARPIKNFIYRMTGDADAAEDVAQEVFVRAYQTIRAHGLHQRRHARFTTWLFQVARHAALDELRRRRRHPAVSLEAMAEGGAALAAAGRPADEETAVREIGVRVARAVALLPEDQRTALVLQEYEGLSQAEIADVMDCSPKSVEARLYRARQFLRTRLHDLLP